MNKVGLNLLTLNAVSLTLSDTALRAGSGGQPTPSIPEGYEEFIVKDGVFKVKEGEFYVKQK